MRTTSGRFLRQSAIAASLLLSSLSGQSLMAQPANPPAAPMTRSMLDSLPAANRGVIEFCMQHIGQSIGDGECASLAEQALNSVNAQYSYGYNWGQVLNPGEPLLPGDIIQFYKCKFKEVTPHRWWVMECGYPDHTAIVRAVEGDRTIFLHQNFAGNRTVHQMTFKLSTLVKGRYTVYRPVPAGANVPGERTLQQPDYSRQLDTTGGDDRRREE